MILYNINIFNVYSFYFIVTDVKQFYKVRSKVLFLILKYFGPLFDVQIMFTKQDRYLIKK